MGARVDLTAFDTVVDDFDPLGVVDVAIAPVVVKPQAKEQHKTRP